MKNMNTSACVNQNFEYAKLVSLGRELYETSVTVYQSEELLNSLESSSTVKRLECARLEFSDAFKDFFRQFDKVHKMDWDLLSNRRKKYLRQFLYTIKTYGTEYALRQFKCYL